MKNIKLPFLCGADMCDRLPSLPRQRDRAGAGEMHAASALRDRNGMTAAHSTH